GPGAGRSIISSGVGYGGGGGHGGYGAASGGATAAAGGSTYGSVTAPVDFGSSGGSDNVSGSPPGAGGGAIRMNVTGALLINGRVSANGGAGVGQNKGGGSGGSVLLTAGTLAGAGTISANGGGGKGPGGGRRRRMHGPPVFSQRLRWLPVCLRRRRLRRGRGGDDLHQGQYPEHGPVGRR